MSRITDAFSSGKAFIPFITCGDPDLNTTKQAVLQAAEHGADIIELGIPFSDPTAEGPVIQAANMRALQAGTTTDAIFECVKDLRGKTDVPFVFMTYANVVFSYGIERFMQRCAQVGIDGIILPDVPFEEHHEFADVAEGYGIDFISMIAPTSQSRIQMIATEAKGFIYVVSSLGVTGMRSRITTNISEIVNHIRECTDVPCAIGFGISTPQQASEMAQISDGAIVGSAIVKLLAEYGTDAPRHIGSYVSDMKEAVNRAN